MVRFIVSVAGLCVSSTALMAGGMERTALSTGFMYEKGGYAEVSLFEPRLYSHSSDICTG